MSAWVAAVAGAGVGIGAVILGTVALRPLSAGAGPISNGQSTGAHVTSWEESGRALWGSRRFWRGSCALAVGQVAGIVTRWPAAGIVAAAAAAGVPVLLAGQAKTATDRVEAIASWTEMLRDTMAASAGLTQAVHTTAPVAPAPIRSQVRALSARLDAGVGADKALRAFADELADPTGDLVVCALVLSVQSQAHRLTELLGSLAQAARDEVAMRLRIETSRASVRSGVRAVTIFSVGFAALLALVAHGYLQPFASARGQVILLGVGALYASGLSWMTWMARPAQQTRLITLGGGGARGGVVDP